MSWTREHDTMLDDLEARESRLTEWEQGFVDSLRRQAGSDRPITTKQLETLDRIWEKATADG